MQAGVVVGDRQVAANTSRVSDRVGGGIAVENALESDTQPLDLAACHGILSAVQVRERGSIGQVKVAHAANSRPLDLLCEYALILPRTTFKARFAESPAF